MYHFFVNDVLGTIGEQSTSKAFQRLGYSVANHDVDSFGCDLLAMRDGFNVAAEVVNWRCKGYVNHRRFNSIVDNLFSEDVSKRYFFAFGADATGYQKRLLKSYKIEYVHFDDALTKVSDYMVKLIADTVEPLGHLMLLLLCVVLLVMLHLPSIPPFLMVFFVVLQAF